MKIRKKVVFVNIIKLLALLFLLCIVFLSVVAIYKKNIICKIKRVDKEHLYVACMSLTGNLDSYIKKNIGQATLKNEVNVRFDFIEDQSLQKEVPEVINQLNPAYITIYSNKVRLCISALPRIYVMAFNEKEEEYGTIELMNKLWIWNGIRNTTTASDIGKTGQGKTGSGTDN